MLPLLVPIGIATVIGLVTLWPGSEPTPVQQAGESFVSPGTTYPDGRVVSVDPMPCPSPGAATAAPQQCATAVVEVLDGVSAGDNQRIDIPAEVVASGVAEGDVLVLSRDAGAEEGAAYRFFDRSRDSQLIVLAVAFALVLGLVARLRGVVSLLGLGFAFVVLLQFVLPGVLAQGPTTLISLVGSAAIVVVVLFLGHGFSARTATALLGALGGITLLAALGSVAVEVASLTGLTSEQAVALRNYDPSLDVSGLVLAGLLVASLGVLVDITVSQADLVWRLHEASPELGWRHLVRNGLAQGRDHLVAGASTVVLASVGAALPVLLLLELSGQPLGVVVSGSVVAEVAIRTMVGAIALVLAGPLTTAAGAFFATAADTEAGAATGQRVSALRARLTR